MASESPSAATREGLDHPVIDCDGHVLEYQPAALPFLRESLGQPLFDRYLEQGAGLHGILNGMDAARRRQTRTPQASWWGTTANSRDLATAAIPRLLHTRMDELGLDYAVLYPTFGLGAAGLRDDEMRRGVCRGFNDFFAHVYRPFSDRLTVVGVVPMHTPEEAIDELEHCREIGLKVVGIPEGVMRPIPSPDPDNPSPWLMPGQTHWFDTFGLDSAHDFDPVWAKFVELGYPMTSHVGIGDLTPNNATSVSNYVFNHLGQFSQPMYNLCKALFMGGVTRRFPTLNLAFLECGVTWACALLNDLVEHWEKRNVVALTRTLDPVLVEWDIIERYMREYGSELITPDRDLRADLRSLTLAAEAGAPAERDDWRRTGITDEDEIYDLFVPRMFFGCEADDRTLAFAFSDANASGTHLQPVFASDIGHWDVSDMGKVLSEAYGLVIDGILTEENFRDFVFTNPAKLYLGANPDFFEGTMVADAVTDLRRTYGTKVAPPPPIDDAVPGGY